MSPVSEVLSDLQKLLPALPVHSWSFFLGVLVVLIFFIWVVARLTASVTGDTDPADDDRQMLGSLSEMRRRGELTDEEYRSIKSRLVQRLSAAPTATGSDDSAQNADQAAENDDSTGATRDSGTTENDDQQDDSADPPERGV